MDNNQRLTISDQPCGFIGYSPRIIPGRSHLNSDPNRRYTLGLIANQRLTISDQPFGFLDIGPGSFRGIPI